MTHVIVTVVIEFQTMRIDALFQIGLGTHPAIILSLDIHPKYAKFYCVFHHGLVLFHLMGGGGW